MFVKFERTPSYLAAPSFVADALLGTPGFALAGRCFFIPLTPLGVRGVYVYALAVAPLFRSFELPSFADISIEAFAILSLGLFF